MNRMNKPSKEYPLLLPVDLDEVTDVILSESDGAIAISYETGTAEEIGPLMLNPKSIGQLEHLGQYIVTGETVPPTHTVTVHISPFDQDSYHGTVILSEI